MLGHEEAVLVSGRGQDSKNGREKERRGNGKKCGKKWEKEVVEIKFEQEFCERRSSAILGSVKLLMTIRSLLL